MYPFFLCFASFSPKEIFRSYALAFKKQDDDAVEDERTKQYSQQLAVGIEYFTTFNKLLILTALSAMLLALVFLLGYIGDNTMFGSGLAVTLLAPFYAIIFMILVTVPFRSALKKKMVQCIDFQGGNKSTI